MGRPRDPGYWRAWRARHPEYRARERERLRRRKLEHPDQARASENARRRRRRAEEVIPAVHTGHPVFELARAVAGAVARPDGMTIYRDPLFEDVVASAALAIIAGEDPLAAARRTAAEERRWRRTTVPLRLA